MLGRRSPGAWGAAPRRSGEAEIAEQNQRGDQRACFQVVDTWLSHSCTPAMNPIQDRWRQSENRHHFRKETNPPAMPIVEGDATRADEGRNEWRNDHRAE